MTEQRTVCVVGTGIAGLSSAIAAVESHAQVVLVCSGELGAEGAAGELAGGNTRLAQGGVAASVGADDTAWAHRADTIAAGYGLVDMLAADRLTADGVRIMQRLIGDGLAVDRGPDGLPALGLEAAHRRPRILHAGGDRTGAVLHAFLVQQLRRLDVEGRVTLLERSTATALIVREGAVVGLNVQESGSHATTGTAASTAAAVSTITADAVVLATGGYAALYPRTSNHLGARGEGIVLAGRAGAAVADLEFVQFHPTALRTADAAGAFLVSEAVRGAGAVLRDSDGNRFMVPAHPAAELAPRDTVSREIDRVLRERGDAQVWLDATAIERDGGPGALAARFPSITAAVEAHGFDWRQEPIPVAPAAHYTMGGVATDLDGRTSVPGLFAAGETASTGVHGANRLASNSLLEGLVFGARAGVAAATEPLAPARDELLRLVRDAEPESSAQPVPHLPASSAEAATQASGDDAVTGLDRSIDTELTAAGDLVGAALADGLGILRDADGIEAARNTCLSVPGPAGELGALIAASAAARTESRGAHQRSDFPTTDPAQARRTAMFTRAPRAALQ